MSNYISPISMDAISSLCNELSKNNCIDPRDYDRYSVKRGLRNSDGTGVMAGLTKVCSVEGYYIMDSEKIPMPGKLKYRGIDIEDIISACIKENRFGFEEVVWILLFGTMPTTEQVAALNEVLCACRELPESFIEDMIMKAPSADVMNKMGRSVLSLYSYDDNPDDISVPNVLRQCLQLIAQMPSIMSYAYQVKRKAFYKKSMYIHLPKDGQSTAEFILRATRADKKFTSEEAHLLDIMLMLHADHGGGNNSTFSTRVLTSTGTDTYSAIAAGIGSLKGFRHGGANAKVMAQLDDILANVSDPSDEGQMKEYLRKIVNRKAADRSGLIYGMGHAVYTISDPRAQILHSAAKKLAYEKGFKKEFTALENIEKLTPEVLREEKGREEPICANVDLYSGLVYRVLNIPDDLFTPLFAVARIVGWSAHRLEEIVANGKIIRPAYKSVAPSIEYVPIEQRVIMQAKYPKNYK